MRLRFPLFICVVISFTAFRGLALPSKRPSPPPPAYSPTPAYSPAYGASGTCRFFGPVSGGCQAVTTSSTGETSSGFVSKGTIYVPTQEGYAWVKIQAPVYGSSSCKDSFTGLPIPFSIWGQYSSWPSSFVSSNPPSKSFTLSATTTLSEGQVSSTQPSSYLYAAMGVSQLATVQDNVFAYARGNTLDTALSVLLTDVKISTIFMVLAKFLSKTVPSLCIPAAGMGGIASPLNGSTMDDHIGSIAKSVLAMSGSRMVSKKRRSILAVPKSSQAVLKSPSPNPSLGTYGFTSPPPPIYTPLKMPNNSNASNLTVVYGMSPPSYGGNLPLYSVNPSPSYGSPKSELNLDKATVLSILENSATESGCPPAFFKNKMPALVPSAEAAAAVVAAVVAKATKIATNTYSQMPIQAVLMLTRLVAIVQSVVLTAIDNTNLGQLATTLGPISNEESLNEHLMHVSINVEASLSAMGVDLPGPLTNMAAQVFGVGALAQCQVNYEALLLVSTTSIETNTNGLISMENMPTAMLTIPPGCLDLVLNLPSSLGYFAAIPQNISNITYLSAGIALGSAVYFQSQANVPSFPSQKQFNQVYEALIGQTTGFDFLTRTSINVNNSMAWDQSAVQVAAFLVDQIVAAPVQCACSMIAAILSASHTADAGGCFSDILFALSSDLSLDWYSNPRNTSSLQSTFFDLYLNSVSGIDQGQITVSKMSQKHRLLRANTTNLMPSMVVRVFLSSLSSAVAETNSLLLKLLQEARDAINSGDLAGDSLNSRNLRIQAAKISKVQAGALAQAAATLGTALGMGDEALAQEAALVLAQNFTGKALEDAVTKASINLSYLLCNGESTCSAMENGSQDSGNQQTLILGLGVGLGLGLGLALIVTGLVAYMLFRRQRGKVLAVPQPKSQQPVEVQGSQIGHMQQQQQQPWGMPHGQQVFILPPEIQNQHAALGLPLMHPQLNGGDHHTGLWALGLPANPPRSSATMGVLSAPRGSQQRSWQSVLAPIGDTVSTFSPVGRSYASVRGWPQLAPLASPPGFNRSLPRDFSHMSVSPVRLQPLPPRDSPTMMMTHGEPRGLREPRGLPPGQIASLESPTEPVSPHGAFGLSASPLPLQNKFPSTVRAQDHSQLSPLIIPESPTLVHSSVPSPAVLTEDSTDLSPQSH